jgi:hypothetical protein
MYSETITRITIPIICSFCGILFGIFFHICWTQRINKIQEYNQIILNNEIDYLKKNYISVGIFKFKTFIDHYKKYNIIDKYMQNKNNKDIFIIFIYNER